MASGRLLIPAILMRRCPHCRHGHVYRHLFSMYRRCPECDYDFYPESGFYLGAMMVPFFFGAMATVPTAITLKLLKYELIDLITILAIFYAFVVALLLFYAKAVWLHLEYRVSKRLKETPR